MKQTHRAHFISFCSLAFFCLLAAGSLDNSPTKPPADEHRSTEPAKSQPPSEPAPPAKPLTSAQKRAQALADAKDKAEADKQQEKQRIIYAKFMEDNLLRNNMSVDVYASGPKHTHLTLKWVLVSKSLAFQFTEQQQDLLRQMKNEGFTKFTITDGYDERWVWDLSRE